MKTALLTLLLYFYRKKKQLTIAYEVFINIDQML